eukprot:4657033-Lingulodinium_polyedra.AAC.1
MVCAGETNIDDHSHGTERAILCGLLKTTSTAPARSTLGCVCSTRHCKRGTTPHRHRVAARHVRRDTWWRPRQ